MAGEIHEIMFTAVAFFEATQAGHSAISDRLYLKYMIDGAKTLILPDEYIATLQRETVE